MFQPIGTEPHPYGQVPVTVFSLNADEVPIFYKIMSLQDAYNTLLSSEVDDFEAFCDAYWPRTTKPSRPLRRTGRW